MPAHDVSRTLLPAEWAALQHQRSRHFGVGPTGPRLASPAVPSASSLPRDLYLRMAALRRVSLLAGIAVAFIFTWTIQRGHWSVSPLLWVVGIGAYNEFGRIL